MAERTPGLRANLIRSEAAAVAEELGVEVAVGVEPAEPDGVPDVVPAGERVVTSLFADVRGYSELMSSQPPDHMSDRMTTLFRLARAAVEQHGGIVDKFAGDAVMATFNVTGARLDHCVSALRVALALRDRAEAVGLGVGIGIAVGPAVLARGFSDDNVSVMGIANNLAARLQVKARSGEVVLSDEAHRRVQPWLAERSIAAEREVLELKGFAEPQVAYRVGARP